MPFWRHLLPLQEGGTGKGTRNADTLKEALRLHLLSLVTKASAEVHLSRIQGGWVCQAGQVRLSSDFAPRAQ